VTDAASKRRSGSRRLAASARVDDLVVVGLALESLTRRFVATHGRRLAEALGLGYPIAMPASIGTSR
jgi:hypothetical protein